MLPGRELGAALKSDRLACISEQGSQTLDQHLHDRLGLAVLVAYHDGIAADALDQRRHIDLPMLFAKHHQIAFPVAELGAFRDAFRPASQALYVGDMGPVVPPGTTWPTTSSVFGQVAIELLVAAIFGIGETIDRFVNHADQMALQPHAARNLFC